MGLNGYSTHSLVKICMHIFHQVLSVNGTIDNVQLHIFSHYATAIANAQCERNLTFCTYILWSLIYADTSPLILLLMELLMNCIYYSTCLVQFILSRFHLVVNITRRVVLMLVLPNFSMKFI